MHTTTTTERFGAEDDGEGEWAASRSPARAGTREGARARAGARAGARADEARVAASEGSAQRPGRR